MFIRSDNLFLRPAWPEDRDNLDRAGVPATNDPLRPNDLAHGLIVTMPSIGQDRIAGTAGFVARGGRWQPRIWLAPAFRHLGLFDEVEEAMFTLMAQMPDPSGPSHIPAMELQAA
ncbi:hypothetical protein [Croceicoccus sp. Ery15]|uniref:hypothetical protein n=1 Tax=Croceicoccus sp. Ery15 TaxID=1703338 RepID=UPI001E2D006A|nr:hypothetical protein [Croceicoccus sp. Ery15]